MADKLSVTIDSTGASAPDLATILASLVSSFQGIYGSDVYLGPDSQDGQFLGVLAQAIDDNNQAVIGAYNSFSPSTALGAALSANVKINGIARFVPSNSTAPGLVVGATGTVIANGSVTDASGNTWILPASVTIPSAGQIPVTVTCATAGAVTASIGTITQINTPVRGWQSFSNTADATPGAPVESDAQLRARQSESVALPARAIVEAILDGVANVPGVLRHIVYENPTGTTDANGIPAHSIAVVVEGGDVQAIGSVIALRKPPGIQTFGTTTVTVTDTGSAPIDVNFSVLTEDQVSVAYSITPLTGYASTTLDAIQQSVVNFINALGIGDTLYLFGLVSAINLQGESAYPLYGGMTQAQLDLLSATYKLNYVHISAQDMKVNGGNLGSGVTTAALQSVGSAVTGSQGLFMLDNATFWPVSLTDVTGTDITFTPAIPAGRSVPNGSQFFAAADVVEAFNAAAQGMSVRVHSQVAV